MGIGPSGNRPKWDWGKAGTRPEGTGPESEWREWERGICGKGIKWDGFQGAMDLSGNGPRVSMPKWDFVYAPVRVRERLDAVAVELDELHEQSGTKQRRRCAHAHA